MPDCDNYGIPARTTPGKPGPSPDRDLHYMIASTNKGRVAALVCKCCGEKPPIKSNQRIGEEVARISDTLKGTDRGCPKKDCDNHGKSSEEYPTLYHKRGVDRATDRPLRSCKDCGSKVFIGIDPPRIHPQYHQHVNGMAQMTMHGSPFRPETGARLASFS